VKALSVHYGQRHVKELSAAKRIAGRLFGVEWREANLSDLQPFLEGSSQTSPEIPVPHGHYTEESMKQTIVPNRNMLMLSIAIAWAISSKFESVAYAAHAGDHAIYPDCREPFVAAMTEAARLCDWHPVIILRPFITMTKAEIVRLGAGLGVPFGETWSCYEGGEVHCGQCGTCQERVWAFQAAGIPDPTAYVGGEIPKLFRGPE